MYTVLRTVTTPNNLIHVVKNSYLTQCTQWWKELLLILLEAKVAKVSLPHL